METIITNLEYMQSFKYNGEAYFVAPKKYNQRVKTTWAIKKSGGSYREFPNDTIVIA